ncbi:alpha/beta hydrolase [Streptomyces sp. NPDC091217]|uniref:alpha/beta hydrolase n=1 Tax=Streptomyces sp. NPDC091217 TaxID=3365975 RepID=UPI0038026DA8
MAQLELVAVPTPTGQPLDGLLYQPSGEVRGAVMLFHGNAMNFYVGASRFLPPSLLDLGFTCLAYNRRAHGTLATRNSRAPEGNAIATVAQSIEDNELARNFLHDRGLPAPALIGHSNGGMLAVRHAADHPDTPALVLLSAHRGGKSMIERGSRTGLLAGDRFDELSAEARRLVAAGRGDELMLFPGWWHVMTARVFCDQLDNLPDIIELAPRIRCPVLYLLGSQEPAELYPLQEFAQRCAGPVDTAVIADCDHFYNGVDTQVTATVTEWLDSVMPARPGRAGPPCR